MDTTKKTTTMMTAVANARARLVPKRVILQEMARRNVRKSFSRFLRVFPPEKPFLRGRHIKDIIRRCSAAIRKVEQGISQYIIINVPFRHGKSGTAFRRLPVWSLIRNPEWEHILATYNYSLCAEMSINARNCFLDAGKLFGLQISADRNQIGSWKLENGGGIYATGIGGTITGRGANVLVIDDYYRGIEEAESETVRERVRHNFESNLMTRLKPAHLVLIIANRWHVDDLVGWIMRKNDPKSKIYDEKFPIFEVIKHPIWSKEHGWLFPECYSEKWYESIKALVGTYAWSAQGMQEPEIRGGNLFKTNKVEVVLPSEWPESLPMRRGWDLASTEKQRMKNDPDHTCGTLACYHNDVIYVADEIDGQWTATKRDQIIMDTAKLDGKNVPIVLEAVAGYIDTFNRIRDVLTAKGYLVQKVQPKDDKVARASVMEAPFETGRVKIRKGGWNDDWLREFGLFPKGPHDDRIDSVMIAIEKQIKGRGFSIS